MNNASSTSISSSAMQANSQRLRHIAENIANADTPGYRRKTVPFETDPLGMVQTGRVQLDRSDLEKIYSPDHPMADQSGYYLGSNVDIMIEIADAREAQQSYEANLKMFDQARQMTAGLLDLLRK